MLSVFTGKIAEQLGPELLPAEDVTAGEPE